MRTEAVACYSAFIHKANALHKCCESWGTRDYDDTNWRTRISKSICSPSCANCKPTCGEARSNTDTSRRGQGPTRRPSAYLTPCSLARHSSPLATASTPPPASSCSPSVPAHTVTLPAHPPCLLPKRRAFRLASCLVCGPSFGVGYLWTKTRVRRRVLQWTHERLRAW